MKKVLLTALTTISLLPAVNAQQDPQFTQFFYNKLIMNPAYAGTKDLLCVTGLYRSQWTGLQGSPTSFLFSADAQLPLLFGQYFGVGFTGYGDFIGFEKNYSFRLALNWRSKQPIGPGYLRAGLDLGATSKGIDGAQWVYPSGVPESSIQALNGRNNIAFEGGVGLYYYSPEGTTNSWYAGISALHLAGMRYADINITQARHMFFMGGYTFGDLFNGDWAINPNVLIKTDFATAQVDLNANAIYKDNYWAGLTYRFEDAIAINAGLNIQAIKSILPPIQIGYSYDINLSRLSSYNSGSHEIVIRYCLPLSKPRPLIPVQSVRHPQTLRNLMP